jgi:predicted outer membrane protein
MKRILISTIAIAAATSFSYAQQQQNQTDRLGQPSGQVGQSGQAGQQREEMGPEHVQKCIREKASDNQYEIQAGQFIEQRSQDQQVKQFAQRLVRDHQQAEQQLQQVAQQAGAQGTQQMNQVHQAKLQELQQKQGPELDRAFIFDQVAGHEKDVLMSQWEAQHEQNPQIKQYAQQQLPVLEEHLRMARRIAEQWVPEARQAGERMPGNTRDRQNSGGLNGQGATGGQNSGTGAGGSQNTGRNSSGR